MLITRLVTDGLTTLQLADLWAWVTDKLKGRNFASEQISGVHAGISHMSIYRYIWRDKRQRRHIVAVCLRRKAKPYRQRLTAEAPNPINDRVSIRERPCIVEERSRIGDWEADTVIGQHHKQAIVTLVERKTGLLKMKRVGHKTAQPVSEAMIELLAPVRLQVKDHYL